MTDTKIVLDKEFQSFIRPLKQVEFDRLEESIKAEGCRDPIVVWKDIIIDGHNRYKICSKNNIPYKTKEIQFNNREEAKLWMINNQLGKRNLTDEERTYLIGKEYEINKNKIGENQYTNPQLKKRGGQNVHPLNNEKTSNQIAKKHNTNEKTVRRAEQFTKAVDTLNNNTEGKAKNTIFSGESGLSKKAVITISKLDKEAQNIVFDNTDKNSIKRVTKATDNELIQLSKKDAKTQKKIVNKAILEDKSITQSTREIVKELAKKVELNQKKKYRVIYADPPWFYERPLAHKYGDVQKHYPTMTIEEICAMGNKIKDITEKDAVLFLWVTSPKLPLAFDVIEAWGFFYKTSFVWDKVLHNCGWYNSARHEFLLIAGKGRSTPDAKKLHDSVVTIEKTKNHSEKPEYFRRLIDSLYTEGNRIELFARQKKEGWDSYGNEL